jgi:hypothetical protein
MERFTSWSPTRLADYEQCPAMARWKHLKKLCPICFEGKVTGGFDTPAVCDTCHKTIVKAPALERGTVIGKAVEEFLMGRAKALPLEVASDESRTVAAKVRKAVLAKTAKVEFQIVLDKFWKPVKQFDRNAWLRSKLDVVTFDTKNRARVIDWKTGGVDKSTDAPRLDSKKYDDQLSIYSTAVLTAFPTVASATSALVFLDAKVDPVVERPSGTLTRADLPQRQVEWNNRVLPMLSDDVFAPCPSNKCRWCDYSTKQGGPCQF